jgi:hypothetical protein
MSQKLDDKTYIKLGKEFQKMLDEQYTALRPDWPQRIKIASVRGFFSGIAGIIGATIGITVLIAVLNAFGALPGIGQFFINIANQISAGAKPM